jgi:hypothetical protein
MAKPMHAALDLPVPDSLCDPLDLRLWSWFSTDEPRAKIAAVSACGHDAADLAVINRRYRGSVKTPFHLDARRAAPRRARVDSSRPPHPGASS